MSGKLVPRLCCSLIGLCVAVFAAAQPEATRDDALTERQQVTAIDLVIELSKDGFVAVMPPADLTPEDFHVEENGRRLPVVGLDVSAVSEPWQLLVYFDFRLSSPASIRWGASALADRASALADLGEVEIVVADPEPRLVLAATRNAVLIDQMLSGIFLESAKGNELLSLREEFLIERDEAEQLSAAPAINALVAEELRIVGEHQDALLANIVGTLPRTARRAVILISDGFDERPEEFYGKFGEVDEAAVGQLEVATNDWARTVAAYGWSVVTLEAPEEVKARTYGLVPTEDERTLSIGAPGIAARLDGTMDPQKAAAHHELGQRLAEQGELEEAEASLKDALRFYHDHSKYSRQRAAVLADLGEVLRRLERTGEARQTIRKAVELDAERASEHPFIKARLAAPAEPLESLAALSGGRIVRSEEELSEAIAGLSRRVRLTFQFQGAPDGQNHEVTIGTETRDFDVRGPSWVRFGTPPTVSALRARQLLAEEPVGGDLVFRCRYVSTGRTYSARTGTLEIEVTTPQPEMSIEGKTVRLTIGIAGEEGPFEIRKELIAFEEGSYSLPIEVDDTDVWLSIIVDDPSTGNWGGASTEL
jgi:tetratricopeptide (TPR) repeat protein